MAGCSDNGEGASSGLGLPQVQKIKEFQALARGEKTLPLLPPFLTPLPPHMEPGTFALSFPYHLRPAFSALNVVHILGNSFPSSHQNNHTLGTHRSVLEKKRTKKTYKPIHTKMVLICWVAEKLRRENECKIPSRVPGT